jgi:hypothetical protein
MMVVPASRKKRGLTTEALRYFKPKDIPVEGDGTLEIGYLKVNMADTNSRIHSPLLFVLHNTLPRSSIV